MRAAGVFGAADPLRPPPGPARRRRWCSKSRISHRGQQLPRYAMTLDRSLTRKGSSTGIHVQPPAEAGHPGTVLHPQAPHSAPRRPPAPITPVFSFAPPIP